MRHRSVLKVLPLTAEPVARWYIDDDGSAACVRKGFQLCKSSVLPLPRRHRSRHGQRNAAGYSAIDRCGGPLLSIYNSNELASRTAGDSHSHEQLLLLISQMSTYTEIQRRVTVCETALREPTLQVFEDIQLPGFREYCFPLILRGRAIHLVMSRLDIEGACVPIWVDMAASHSGAFTDMLRDCLLGHYASHQQREEDSPSRGPYRLWRKVTTSCSTATTCGRLR